MDDRSLSPRRRLLVAALIGAVSTAGCARTVTHRVARFEPPAGAGGAGRATETMLAVPEAGMWKVKVRGRGEREYHGIDGTERFLQAGDVVGFRTGADGVVYAVANRDQVPLALTGEHRRVAWHARTQNPTSFGLSLGEAMQVSGEVATIVALGALALWAWTASSSDNDRGDGARGFNHRQ